jgi:hypothetical protein
MSILPLRSKILVIFVSCVLRQITSIAILLG